MKEEKEKIKRKVLKWIKEDLLYKAIDKNATNPDRLIIMVINKAGKTIFEDIKLHGSWKRVKELAEEYGVKI